MIAVWLAAYAAVACVIMAPFRISSRVSRREEEELREAKSQFGVCKTIYSPIYKWDEEARR